ncbi:uncharacterized protein LOC135392988 isoform X2 [Ornithodoros turicata]|uniref:uncharacterized protein LOC135392988 isoform X2 n=1 Tax=Ornithodoros turicata TaxID=34597 RepID=UPI00313A4A19
MNMQDYIDEGLRQLACATFYKTLDTDPTEQIVSDITKHLKALKAAKKIDSAVYEYLLPRNSKPGRFYMLPKIHKPGNPGRPIVSCNGTATEKLSSFVDHLLKDIPPRLPSYIKDTNHFLQILNQCQPPPSSLLVTLDVSSLYTNIPHDDAEAPFSKYSDSSCDPSVVSTLLELILKNNNFEFNDGHYLQVNGTAMGTKMAPNYANLFVGSLEEAFLSTREDKHTLYKRYLDDIFMIWPHSEDSLLEFIRDFNEFHTSINFTHTYSAVTVSFLDVQIKQTNGVLTSDLFRKPTDSQQYLSFHSCHPRHTKLAIPYSQALRYRRICSNDDDLDRNLEQL